MELSLQSLFAAVPRALSEFNRESVQVARPLKGTAVLSWLNLGFEPCGLGAGLYVPFTRFATNSLKPIWPDTMFRPFYADSVGIVELGSLKS